MALADLNACDAAELERRLLACCSSPRWASRVAAARPYESSEELYRAADAALAELDDAEFDAALAGHPRIGERADSPSSAREQSAVSTADAETLAALAAGNRAYEQRFGHVYLVCADGRSGADLLAVLHRRLTNDPATERATARAELAKINRIRLRRLIGADE